VEAIETSMTHAQIVTVPILDARFQEFEARFQEFRADIRSSLQQLEVKIEHNRAEFATQLERSKADRVRWVFLVTLGNVALSAGATAILNVFQHSR
jgi:hypothetical protein